MEARIWAGFHYRFSTRVGAEIRRRLGGYAVKTVLQPGSTWVPPENENGSDQPLITLAPLAAAASPRAGGN